MQLDYKILWIDDEESFIKTHRVKIEKHIVKDGFKPIIDYFTKFEENIIDKAQNYNIIFIDYRLSGDKNGDELIANIRARKVYTNIVFYSSEPNKIIEETAEKRLSGVYIFDREQFNDDDILELIGFFLKKDMNEHTMRGIVMSEVAHFDALIWELLKNKKMNGTNICKNCVSKRVKTQKESSWNTVKDISEDDLWTLIEKKGTMILDSEQRSIVLHADMIGKQVPYKAEKSKLSGSYPALLNARNELAHKIDTSFSEEQFLKLRISILEFRELFKNLETKLEKMDD